MGKKLIVIADTDKDYLAALELKIAEKWADDAQIEVITQLKYFNEFFGRPRDIYLLVIHELLYTDKVKKQNIRHSFVLTEEEKENPVHGESKVSCIYKYLSIQAICQQLFKTVYIDKPDRTIEKTKLFTVYAAGGGCGKTFAALGIAAALGRMGRRVLYVNIETIQDFAMYMENKSYAGASAGYAVAARKDNVAHCLMQETQTGIFDYIKPFEKSPLAYQMTEDTWLEAIQKLCHTRFYDALIVDASREITREKIRLFDMSDKIITVCMQTEASFYQTERFLENMVRENEKWIFICGRYREKEENVLKERKLCGEYSMTEYIPEIQKTSSECAGLLKEAEEKHYFYKTVYMMEE